MELSLPERWIISNQLRILEALYPEDAESLAVEREAIERGYEFVYDINSPIDTNTMNEADCREVWDTLDMFRAIDNSINELNTDEFENHPRRKFCGYDGNNETKFMAFTSYTVERLERWTELSPEKPGYYNSFNSNCPMRPIYKDMLEKWQDICGKKRFHMDREQIRAIFGSTNS